MCPVMNPRKKLDLYLEEATGTIRPDPFVSLLQKYLVWLVLLYSASVRVADLVLQLLFLLIPMYVRFRESLLFDGLVLDLLS